MTHRSRHHPDEQEQEREPDKLHPARDLDRGRPRHSSDGIAEIRRIRKDSWDWTEGALALEWVEPRLNDPVTFDTVPPDMPSSRSSRRRRVERREVRDARRTRRFALLTVLAVVLVIALALTAFGGGPAANVSSFAVSRSLATATQPFPQIVAVRGPVRLQMPITQSQATAIGYHSSADGALTLAPLGHQGNEGVVQRVFHAVFGGAGGHPTWYRLDGGSLSALDVGAAPGTDVYSPVDGTVVGIAPFVVAGHRFGSQIDIQPQNAPSLVVTLTQIRPDAALRVGNDVVSGRTKVGAVVDLSRVEHQGLARYTNDAGDHVSIEVRPSAALALN